MPSPELLRLKEFLINYRNNLQRTVDEMTLWISGLEQSIESEEELVSVKDDLSVLSNCALEHLQRSAEQGLDGALTLEHLQEQGLKIELLPSQDINIKMPKEKMSPGLIAFIGDHKDAMRDELRRRHGTDKRD
jgi:hypothetical protein